TYRELIVELREQQGGQTPYEKYTLAYSLAEFGPRRVDLIEPGHVSRWLTGLKKKDGEPMARQTKKHILRLDASGVQAWSPAGPLPARPDPRREDQLRHRRRGRRPRPPVRGLGRGRPPGGEGGAALRADVRLRLRDRPPPDGVLGAAE